MRKTSWRGRALLTVLLGTAIAGCEFIEPVTADPNAVPNATVDQLFVGVQVNTYLLNEGEMSRYFSMWLQQMAGTDRQFSDTDIYVLSETEGQWNDFYTGGGLVDIRKALRLAEEDGRTGYVGVLKVMEAYFIGTAASVYGDVVYSEAVDTVTEPRLDEQADVYAAVQALLDDAISDLTTGGGGPTSADFGYGGDLASWIDLAYTLKARFYMHWGEVSSANYGLALAAAQNGITAAAGDWVADHSTASTENNLWFQFMRDRSGYITAGEFGVELLKSRGDPRLTLYYDPVDSAGTMTVWGSPVGSPVGDPGPSASPLALAGAGAAGYDYPMVTCAETYFIIAEATSQTGGTDADVRTALDNAIACDATRKGVDLSAAQAANDGLTGAALFQEVMLQKYMALFLNPEIMNDYKRTCLPAVVTYQGEPIPGRLFYDNNERQSNSNIPDALQQPARNDNDPNPC